MTEFGPWLDRIMTARRVTGRALAVRSGVDHASISRIRRGQRSPSMDTADKLCRALRVTWTLGVPEPVPWRVPGTAHSLAFDGADDRDSVAVVR